MARRETKRDEPLCEPEISEVRANYHYGNYMRSLGSCKKSIIEPPPTPGLRRELSRRDEKQITGSKQIKRIPAELDPSGLPAGSGFGFEWRWRDTTGNLSKPIFDQIRVLMK